MPIGESEPTAPRLGWQVVGFLNGCREKGCQPGQPFPVTNGGATNPPPERLSAHLPCSLCCSGENRFTRQECRHDGRRPQRQGTPT